jgi:hypothetical protein
VTDCARSIYRPIAAKCIFIISQNIDETLGRHVLYIKFGRYILGEKLQRWKKKQVCDVHG